MSSEQVCHLPDTQRLNIGTEKLWIWVIGEFKCVLNIIYFGHRVCFCVILCQNSPGCWLEGAEFLPQRCRTRQEKAALKMLHDSGRQTLLTS